MYSHVFWGTRCTTTARVHRGRCDNQLKAEYQVEFVGLLIEAQFQGGTIQPVSFFVVASLLTLLSLVHLLA